MGVEDDPARIARESLQAVEAGGRAEMGELRNVMGLLTMDLDLGGTEDENLDPQPGLDRLEALVGRMRSAGVPVELTASGADASVQVSYGDDELHVEITDTGGTPGPAAATGNGRGLIGLRERLAVHGGTLRTGPARSAATACGP